MKVVADDKIPFLKGVLEPFGEVVYLPGGKIAPQHVRDADALVTRTRTRCNAGLLDGSRVRLIASATIGFDHIDAGYCKRRGITWTNAAGCNAGSVAQWIAAALVSLARRFAFALAGKTLGIVGVGHVGRRVDQLAQRLGMQVLRNDPPRMRAEGSAGFVSLDEVLQSADLISLHVPLTFEGPDRTFHLIDSPALGKLRPGACLLNSSRGEVVDSSGLKEALVSGKLRSAVLDVWENEPEIDTSLLALVTLGTPHIAGYSVDGKAGGTAMSVQALSRFFGLGLDGWYPCALPLPNPFVLNIDCQRKSVEEVLMEAIRATYDIEQDDRRLRASVSDFEEQRGNYPVRREFLAYQVQAIQASDAARRALRDLGFQVLGSTEAR